MYCIRAGDLCLCISFLLSLFSIDLNCLPFRKDWHPKESRREAEESPGALFSHSSRNEPCLAASHASELCLCGCSLRTKAVLHPRPLPVSRPSSQMLPTLPPGKKHPSTPGIVFRAQSSQSLSEPKAKAMSQLLPQSKSRASLNAMPLRKLVPMTVWPQGFLYPLSKSLPKKSLHAYIPRGGSRFPRQRAMSPITPLVESDKPQSFLSFMFK